MDKRTYSDRKEYIKQYRLKNQDKIKQYYQDNKDKINKLRNKNYTKEQGRKNNLKRYNITLEEYNELIIAQDFRCAICGQHQSELKRTLFVDHCHITGEVRGLLCQNCNAMLGHAKDNIKILNNAIKYLKN